MSRPIDNSPDSEYAVIGNILIDNAKVNEVDLEESDFFIEQNRMIFSAITALIADNVPADVITVSEYLNRITGREWIGLLGGLVSSTVPTKFISAYSDVIKGKSQFRGALSVARDLKASIEAEGLSAIDDAIGSLLKITRQRQNFDCKLSDAVTGMLDEIDDFAQSGQKIKGIRSGLTELDNSVGGFHNSDLTIIGARPAMGKTAILLNFANASEVSAGIISAEQPRNQVGLRFVSMAGRVSAHKMRLADLTPDEWSRATDASAKLMNKEIWINDQPAPHIKDVVSQGRAWVHKYKIKILFIDYIQRITGDKDQKRHEQVDMICRSLKQLARELDIPVVALSQINRDVEKRPNKRPLLSDFLHSGAIEQEADNIYKLYRDEVYYAEKTKYDGIAELTKLKNRHGPTGSISVKWLKQFMIFEDLDNVLGYQP